MPFHVEIPQCGQRAGHAVLAGRRRELSNASLARFLVRYPLMPVQVIALIHWQALKLWLKRCPVIDHPGKTPASLEHPR